MLSRPSSINLRCALTGHAESLRWPFVGGSRVDPTPGRVEPNHPGAAKHWVYGASAAWRFVRSSAFTRLGWVKALGRLKAEPRTGAASCVAAGVALLFLAAASGSNARQVGEYEVKAAFLLNFAKFVEWPPQAFQDSKGPFVIGIVGDDPFGDTLQQVVKGQTAQRRRIEIHHFKLAEDFGNCHLLFVSDSLAAQTDHILMRLQGRPVLTASEKEEFVRQGGVIGFALVDKSVRFDVNPQAAAAVDLKISSKLLAVAREVLQSP